MYDWRKLTESQRTELLQFRRQMSRPWHSPPHRQMEGLRQYILTGTCYEHAPVIGHTPDRLESFATDLLRTAAPYLETIHAWCILPNHCHMVLSTTSLRSLEAALGQLHGRTSYEWNGEDNRRKRKVWYNCSFFPSPVIVHEGRPAQSPPATAPVEQAWPDAG